MIDCEPDSGRFNDGLRALQILNVRILLTTCAYTTVQCSKLLKNMEHSKFVLILGIINNPIRTCYV